MAGHFPQETFIWVKSLVSMNSGLLYSTTVTGKGPIFDKDSGVYPYANKADSYGRHDMED